MLSSPEVRDLIMQTYGILRQGVDKHLPTEVNAATRYALEQNTFIFSGFKTYHSLRDVGLSLTKADGSIKPYADFQKDVERINATYNRHYLRAEYQHAVSSSLMAARWQQIEADGDKYDLQYRTAGDERVRDEHAILDGTTLPPSDPFWSRYLPPNGWGCRCTAVQVRRGKYPQSDPALAMERGNHCTAAPKQQIFRFNPGKDLKIFPPKHPYLPKGCGGCKLGLKLAYNPNSDKCKACGIIAKCMQQYMPPRFETLVTYKNGGQVRVSSAITDRESLDYKRILSAAMAFAQQGRKADLLPRFSSPKRCDSYKQIYNGIEERYYGKCPDLLIDGLFYEHEGYVTNNPKNALHNMLAHGLIQSDRIIIEKCNLTDAYIIERIKGKINAGLKVTEVWEHSNGMLRLIYNNIGA